MRRHRRLARSVPAAAALAAILLGSPRAIAVPEPGAPAKWIQRIGDVVEGEPVSVQIAYGGEVLYRHRDWVARPPASNEKLLLSLALLDRLPSKTTVPLRALTTRKPVDGVIDGDVWIVGHGDPETGPADMRDLAAAIAAKGVRRIRGHVYGATGPFARDWFAPGWKDYFPTYYIALPTALTFEGNVGPTGRHISDPERRAAASLTAQLEHEGISVTKQPGLGSPPSRLKGLATVASDPLVAMMKRMNTRSRNFYAEVFGKLLGARRSGSPGTIAKGARAIEAFAAAHGVSVVANDASGLSYANRVTVSGIVDLLEYAETEPWGATLRETLPKGGQGTLEGRFADVRLRAKTGTLDEVSALSGWVWLERVGDWAEFSILSKGITKTHSMQLENAIVRVVNANAAPPA
jgi:serine-type D-Ala-D-Ala carboxypeptidase/endopeptidase (penicillin-binding protein 4)